MAERMSLIAAATATATAMTLTASPALQAADAQPGLADPTRPPSVAPATAREIAGAPAQAAPMRLQSVLISRNRKIAVINGRSVPLGGKIDDATLVRVAETHVILKKGDEMQTLELYSGIERKPVKSASDTGKKKGSRP